MKENMLIGALVVVALIGFGAAGADSMAEAQRYQEEYCANVKLWNEENARGVVQNERFGHSDYRGIAEEICK